MAPLDARALTSLASGGEVLLGDLIVEAASGFPCSRSKLVPDGLPHLRPFNIGRRGELDLSELYRVPSAEAPKGKGQLRTGDVLFNNTNSVELVGRAALVREDAKAGFSNHLTRLRLDRERADPAYVAAFLNTAWRRGTFEKLCTRWVGQAAVNQQALARLRLFLPSLQEQRRIVGLLDRAASIVRLREIALAKAREVIPALFVSMFGDPATNPMGWQEERLDRVADVQGGLQVTSARSSLPLEVPYLRVANVLRDRLDLMEIKALRVTAAERDRVALRAKDLLIVEGHGNPLEIGRVALWDGSIEPCLHQNHLIRVRVDGAHLCPEFTLAYLNSETGRQELLRSGKTTSGLNTISTANVKTLKVLLPPLAVQARFAGRLRDLRSIIGRQEHALTLATAAQHALAAQLLG